MAKQENFNTPAGVARYPWLNKPDTAEGKKFKMDPTYHVDLILEGDDANALKAQIDKWISESSATGQEKIDTDAKYKDYEIETTAPYEAELDDDGDETGRTIFKFKMKAEGTDRDGNEFTRKPVLFDKFGERYEGAIFGGSVIEVNFGTYQYQMVDKKRSELNCGVTLRLRAVRVVEPAEGNATAENYGFAKDSKPATEAPAADVSEGDGADGDY